ncbi:MAG TPA: hypothetical protein VMH50_11735 [Thermoleophilia bacterium]|nr:hypothetical protein [Thermoleophilia bacterium]
MRKWPGFTGKEGIITLGDAMRLFSEPMFTKRLEADYFSHMSTYVAGLIPAMDSLQNAGSYWRLKWFEKLGTSFVAKLKSRQR